MKKTLLLVAAAAILAAPVMAFHDQGVAHCDGCHTMHNSQDGALVDPDSPNGNPWLLTDATPSDMCLSCHGGQVFGTDPDSPPNNGTGAGGGNFVFLLADNLNDGHSGSLSPIPGDAAGHNVVAPGNGLLNDATLNISPGGGFPSGILSCTSCHDPHGTQAFRMLYGAGRVVNGFFPFTADAPEAVGISFRGAEAPDAHTAYQDGMSAWCGNCHGDFHTPAAGVLVHPSGEAMGATIATTYNLYNGTVDQLGGAATTAYLPEVPFEDLANTDTASTAGPSAGSQVSCITCHRAHASSAPDAGRWDFAVTFLHEDGVESGSFQIPDPYLNLNQRSLCNKCHNQDVDDLNPF